MILGQRPITLIVRAAGTRGTDGYWIPGTETTSTIYAGVQPFEGEEFQLLPEGERKRDPRWIATTTAIRIVSQYDATSCDQVEIDGVRYDLAMVGREFAVIPHYYAKALRVQEAE